MRGRAVGDPIAGDVADREVFEAAVAAVAHQLDAENPFRLVGRVGVVVLVVVALDRAVDEVRVGPVADLDDDAAATGELVHLERGAVEVEREAVGQREAPRGAQAVEPRQEHDPAHAARRGVVEKPLEPLGRPHGVGLDPCPVVGRAIDHARAAAGALCDLAVLRRGQDQVAVGRDGRRPLRLVETPGDVVRQRRVLEILEVADLDGDQRAAGAVVADAVRPQVVRRHAVDLLPGNRQVGGCADEEFVPDHVGGAALRVAALDRELVVAGGERAEGDRVVAGGQRAGRAGGPVRSVRREAHLDVEAEGVVAVPDEAVVPVGHEESDPDRLVRRDDRFHMLRGDVGHLKVRGRGGVRPGRRGRRELFEIARNELGEPGVREKGAGAEARRQESAGVHVPNHDKAVPRGQDLFMLGV